MEQIALKILVNGAMLSVILILFALGLSLVFGIMRIVNFAHGEIYMLGGFAMWFFYAQHNLNWVLSLVLTVVLVAFIGVLMERFFFRKFRGDFLSGMVISVGLILIMQASVATGWGFLDHAIPTPSAFKGVIHTLGVTLPKERLYVMLICAAVVVAMYLFLMRTKHGRSIRATSQNSDAAALQGIGVDRTCAIAMGIGAALAAMGGALVGSVFLVNPYMGGSQLLNGLVVIVIGRMGSLPGIIIGAFMIGFTQVLGSMYLSSAIAGMLIFLLLIVTLVVRPTGLFGRAEHN